MQYSELFILAFVLSFDTFAVSVSSGLTVSSIRFGQGVKIALVLAFFQALMPLLGWIGGVQASRLVGEYDHWLAFGLLSLLGLNMIRGTFAKEEGKKFNPLLMTVLLGMAIATSIDAMVAGVSLALFSTNIYMALLIIGVITFLAAMLGMLLGKKATFGLGKKVELMGGVILIGLGIRILVSHLG